MSESLLSERMRNCRIDEWDLRSDWVEQVETLEAQLASLRGQNTRLLTGDWAPPKLTSLGQLPEWAFDRGQLTAEGHGYMRGWNEAMNALHIALATQEKQEDVPMSEYVLTKTRVIQAEQYDHLHSEIKKWNDICLLQRDRIKALEAQLASLREELDLAANAVARTATQAGAALLRAEVLERPVDALLDWFDKGVDCRPPQNLAMNLRAARHGWPTWEDTMSEYAEKMRAALADYPFLNGLLYLIDFMQRHNVALEAQLASLRKAAAFKHNVIIHDDSKKFVGEWIAVPRADFDALRVALAAQEKSAPQGFDPGNPPPEVGEICG